MKQKYRRFYFIVISLFSVGFGLWLILKNFKDNIVFFYTPSEIKKQLNLSEKVIRVGGLVKKNSIKKLDGFITEFTVTDLEEDLIINYKGILPNLFRDEQGVVAKGKIENNIFIASELLAKHDENYIPKEIHDSIKKGKCSTCIK